jgi:xanthine dehydrogenase accessory factor
MAAVEQDVFDQAAAWLAEGRKVAFGTVVETWGSSPRPPGSRLAVDERGAFVGSVSGGCIEGAVVTEAIAAMGDGRPRLLSFGVTNEMAWEVGLACGGRVQVFVEAVPPGAGVLDELRRDRREKRAVVLATTLPTGENRLVYPDAPAEGEAADVREGALRALARDRCVTVEREGGASVFLQPFNAPLRLVLVGAVHIAQPLAQMAALSGFEVVIVDPRSAFATEDRFPGVRLVTSWPDRALRDLALDARSAVVTLTHDPKLDDPALEIALRSPCFYVGCLGSGKTHAARVERLRGRGFGDAEIARVFGPVGLRIGARSPAEIAVSILGQIVEQLRRE